MLLTVDAYSQVTDIDGNQYQTIEIGNLEWMASNLRVTKSSEGRQLNIYPPNQQQDKTEKYGLLYDFNSATQACPLGWRLPGNFDWLELFEGELQSNAGNYKAKNAWGVEVNKDTSGFSALPAGYGNNGEHPNKFTKVAIFWSKDMEDKEFGWTFILELNSEDIRQASQHLEYGFSVRCVR
ncbi:FISUMP domain-containing protein [Aliiglaciecola sp. M165]|uniref:FISUMP domain-containing protein n=1 Tax=Aliiglaciecola sp. M165 TaxID=2593649 RepID=UPI00163D4242|nr:FISUMP domain-containing protein [Aliiglaciecola sp. M165]